MATQTIETIHQAFIDWRAAHRKGPYPRHLKSRAMSALSREEQGELGHRLGLSAAQLKAWRSGSAPAPSEDGLAASDAGFCEVKSQSVKGQHNPFMACWKAISPLAKSTRPL